MRTIVITSLAALSLFACATASRADEIGSVNTAWHVFGSDKIVIEAFDDPKVPGVACDMSRARTGGISGAVGLATDTSDFSLACRQIGPIDADLAQLKKSDGEDVVSESASLFAKTIHLTRFVDLKRRTIVYLVHSDKVIDGSPKNSISSVPVMPWH